MRELLMIKLVTLLLLQVNLAHADTRPNIVLIVADDVGYADIGVFGSEIKTPNLDTLAADGLQLTNFLTAPSCGPTRTMLLTGIDHHRVGAGINTAGLMRLPHLRGRPGYEGYLNSDAVTFATLLKDTGYHTFMTGKWDPGRGPGRLPADRGFERSFVLAAGGASHFSDAVGTFKAVADAHYYEDQGEVESLPTDFYSSKFYTDRMMQYVDDINDDSPFLAYVSYTAAHWPLQVPDAWLNKYEGRYEAGWDALRTSRFKRQKALGVIPAYAQLPQRNRAVDDWQTLTEKQKAIETKRMEIYAAMIENMDFHIGRLLDKVATIDSARDTVVIFLSDNGAEGNAIQRIIGNDEWIPERFDNSLDNMGRVNSYVWLGPGWAQANVTPYRIYKSYTTAGGIRTPAIVADSGGRFGRGIKTDAVTVRDIAPTILELAEVAMPGNEYQGKPVLPVSGKSAVAYLSGNADSLHHDEALGWELYGSRALLKDEWKAIRIFPPEGSGEWELFNVHTDPTETANLATDFPQVLTELIADWDNYAKANGVAIFEEDLGYGRYADEPPETP